MPVSKSWTKRTERGRMTIIATVWAPSGFYSSPPPDLPVQLLCNSFPWCWKEMEDTRGSVELQNWRIYGRERERETWVLSAPKSWSIANQHLTQHFLCYWKWGLLMFTWVWKCVGTIARFVAVGWFFFFSLSFSSVMVEVGRWQQTEAAGFITRRGNAAGRLPWPSCSSRPENSVAAVLFCWHLIIFSIQGGPKAQLVITHSIVLL